MLVPDRAHGHIDGVATARRAVLRLPALVRSGFAMARQLRAVRPDVIVHLYDLVGALACAVRLPGIPRVTLAHNYLVEHRAAGPLPSGAAGGMGLRLLSAANALGARAVLGLSFDPLAAQGRLRTAPPLLRSSLEQLEIRDDGFLLAYALNPGYARRIAQWQRTRPEVEVHCFVEGGARANEGGARAIEGGTRAIEGGARAIDGAGLPPTGAERAPPAPRPGLHLHDLDGPSFLDHLARCRAYVGTAGFESVCEAFWLGKPALVIPVEGHFEQRFNAGDAVRAGAARAGDWDDLDEFWRSATATETATATSPDRRRVDDFRRWVASAGERIVGEIEAAARGAAPPQPGVRSKREG